MASGPIIVAHRGWWRSTGLVENSRRAFEAAIAGGFPAECDVWASADGEPVVIHDETLDRMTTAQGKIASYTADALRHVRMRAPEPQSTVPLLKEVADLVSYVEVKPPDSPRFVRRVIEVMGARQWLLQAFDAGVLQHARDLKPNLATALLVDDAEGFETALNNGWPVHADHMILSDEIVARFRGRGLRIGAWTVNTEAEIRRVLAWNLDVIISDEPALVREMLESRPGATNRVDSST